MSSRIFTVLKPCVIDHKYCEKNSTVIIKERDARKDFVFELMKHGFIIEMGAKRPDPTLLMPYFCTNDKEVHLYLPPGKDLIVHTHKG